MVQSTLRLGFTMSHTPPSKAKDAAEQAAIKAKAAGNKKALQAAKQL